MSTATLTFSRPPSLSNTELLAAELVEKAAQTATCAWGAMMPATLVSERIMVAALEIHRR